MIAESYDLTKPTVKKKAQAAVDDTIPATDFKSRVYEVVKRIPSGTVATYGQIAAYAGNPKAARAVGNALHVNPDPDHTPCYRVVNAQGKLTGAFAFGGINRQRELLEEDGIDVLNYYVDLTEFQWQPNDR